MSQENVDLTRAAYEQFSRGDFSRLFEANTDDFEFVTAAEMPDAGTYRGQEARDWILVVHPLLRRLRPGGDRDHRRR